MNARDELAELVMDHFHPGATGGSSWRLNPTAAAEAILAAGYRKPRTITTAEELDTLPTDSTVRSAEGGIWFKETSGKGCSWTEPGAQWWHWSTDISLPATVLYEPVMAA